MDLHRLQAAPGPRGWLCHEFRGPAVKRSGFALKRCVTAPPAPPRRSERAAVMARSDQPARPAPKVRPIESPLYRELVRQLPCARCGHVGATQFCHADQGKGMARKTDDRMGWAGCGPHDATLGCHYLIGSSGHYPKERRRCLEQLYARWTRQQIIDAGLWPDDLPAFQD